MRTVRSASPTGRPSGCRGRRVVPHGMSFWVSAPSTSCPEARESGTLTLRVRQNRASRARAATHRRGGRHARRRQAPGALPGRRSTSRQPSASTRQSCTSSPATAVQPSATDHRDREDGTAALAAPERRQGSPDPWPALPEESCRRSGPRRMPGQRGRDPAATVEHEAPGKSAALPGVGAAHAPLEDIAGIAETDLAPFPERLVARVTDRVRSPSAPARSSGAHAAAATDDERAATAPASNDAASQVRILLSLTFCTSSHRWTILPVASFFKAVIGTSVGPSHLRGLRFEVNGAGCVGIAGAEERGRGGVCGGFCGA